jgi:hypothetical protein
MVAANGIGVEVDIGIALSVGETTVTAGAHEIKIRAMSNNVLIFLAFIDTLLRKELPNGSR